eukprot:3826883-Pyramimonas_sp.AAC.1
MACDRRGLPTHAEGGIRQVRSVFLYSTCTRIHYSSVHQASTAFLRSQLVCSTRPSVYTGLDRRTLAVWWAPYLLHTPYSQVRT